MEGKLIKVEDGYLLIDVNTSNEDRWSVIGSYPFNKDVEKLSLKNCQAIENGYDLDELAREACDITDPLRLDSQKYKQDPYFKIGFNKGFQKALEILVDKKFSEGDMRRALSAGLSIGYGRQFEIENKQIEIENYIQSLQKTEWDVEVEMEEVLNMDYKPSFGGGSDSHYNPMYVSQPKLDADDCLILKRK